jgi:MYXO-CTERM domain-containing protein
MLTPRLPLGLTTTLIVGLLCVLGSPGVGQASFMIEPGFDLFRSTENTVFDGIPLVGVPLGTFNFGPPIGVRNVGDASTIVERQAAAAAPGPGPAPAIPIELVALQLMSQNPVDLNPDPGVVDEHLLFVTLQSERGGEASTGEMVITFNDDHSGPGPHGTFTSFFDVFFDIRIDSLNGPIITSGQLPLQSCADEPPPTDECADRNVPWSHLPPDHARLITGVNFLLNGVNRQGDFWPGAGLPGGEFCEDSPEFPRHDCVTPASKVPQPAALVLFGLGLFALGRRRDAVRS